MSPIQLKDRQPIAKGGLRLIYEHPDNPDLLIKVMRPEAVACRYGKQQPWYKRRRRFGAYVLFARETMEFLATWASHGRTLPIAQRIAGFVDTDMGLGLVTDAVRSPGGELAPTLAHLIDHRKFDTTAKAALEEFLQDLLACDLVLSDLHERNLVYGAAPDGSRRFVMIDGIGASTILPFKAISRSFNRRNKEAKVRRLRERMKLRARRASEAV
jgi:hypothetical protein